MDVNVNGHGGLRHDVLVHLSVRMDVNVNGHGGLRHDVLVHLSLRLRGCRRAVVRVLAPVARGAALGPIRVEIAVQVNTASAEPTSIRRTVRVLAVETALGLGPPEAIWVRHGHHDNLGVVEEGWVGLDHLDASINCSTAYTPAMPE